MKTWDNKNTDRLAEALVGLSEKRAMKNFLRDLMTEGELKELGNRWEAAQMLSENVPYTRIVKETGLSSATVARISKWLNSGMGGYLGVLSGMGVHHHAAKSGSSKVHRH